LNFEEFLSDIRLEPTYADQMVHVRRMPARRAAFAEPERPFPGPVRALLAGSGIERLYTHQAEAVELVRAGRDVVVATGTASGKSLCYVIPIAEALPVEPDCRTLLLFPTKALCQDQFQKFRAGLDAAGLDDVFAGVFDGDTPGNLRRRLRDRGRVIFSNPDMLHAALTPQHARWADFLANLRLLVLDELHVYSGIFGSNMANLMRRFLRICAHYGSRPQIVASSATIANPAELAAGLCGRDFALVDDDGSPRGERTYVFWNPPRVRGRMWRSRRSANVEAHELMAMLIQRGVPTITFSKAKMTAEMIHRYVSETLACTAPNLVSKITPYRGGYLPGERRDIERRLFDGELLGVSTTAALELGIDVGGLDASILVGYPGTLASFFQQSGRAGRQDRPALIVLVGLDTSVNQYIMSHPEHVFGRPVERGVIDPDNPFVVTGHLRCATHELPLGDDEAPLFGPHAQVALRILEENRKVRRIRDRWYHAASETPHHEFSLRAMDTGTVLIEDADSGQVLGEVTRLDAPPILHPEAIYMHRGDTYRVQKLDLEKNVATVKRVEVDYYTQPLGGTDVHHVDNRLREKPFGTGNACWGEVTAYFNTGAYEKVHFYSLDAVSVHPLQLPTFALDTMALWLVPPEELMDRVRLAGLDAHAGLRGIGYATRMLLPLFITCDALDFSHSVGSVNSEWNAVFIYERYPLGLGFTEKAYERLHEIMPTVLDNVRSCPCDQGCPCCVGKPLRQYATWNVERGEGSIPSKAAALMILEALLRDRANLCGTDLPSATSGADELNVERALRRRLERAREPQVFHPIEPRVPLGYPDREPDAELVDADVARRARRRRDFHRDLRKRIAKHIETDQLSPHAGKRSPPPGMRTRASNLPPTAFPGRPVSPVRRAERVPPKGEPGRAARKEDVRNSPPIKQGDPLAARARRLKKRRQDG